MAVRSFRDLIVWQKSMDFVVWTYNATAGLPYYERFGLASQLQRAAVSIPSNIAEGSRRRSPRDFKHFCNFAHGSAAEAETQLLIVERIYPRVDISAGLELLTEIQKILSVLTRPTN